MGKTITYIKNFLENKNGMGSITPSSKTLGVNIVRKSELSTSKKVLEIGTGLGGVTKHILDFLPEKSSYLGIDNNEDLVNLISEHYPFNDFLRVDAFKLKDLLNENNYSPDRVICGLPWSLFNKKEQEVLLNNIYDSLEENGILVGYLYKPNFKLQNVNSFKKVLETNFPNAEFSKIIYKNIPPAIIYKAKK